MLIVSAGEVASGLARGVSDFFLDGK